MDKAIPQNAAEKRIPVKNSVDDVAPVIVHSSSEKSKPTIFGFSPETLIRIALFLATFYSGYRVLEYKVSELKTTQTETRVEIKEINERLQAIERGVAVLADRANREQNK